MFWNRKRSTVHVEFVDANTGTGFAQTDISPEQLPASFEAETTMHLGDQDWLVVSATPMTSLEFRASGRLRLVLTRVERTTIDTRELVYSLPTIADGIPAPAAAGSTKLGKRILELHEDDWRQIEVYATANDERVDLHLAAVRAIHESSRSGSGFTRVHVRDGCDALLTGPGCSLTDLREACPPGSEWLEGVALLGLPGIIEGSFVVRLPSCVTLYGMATNDRMDVLGIQPPRGAAFDIRELDGVAAFMRARRLGVVEWCRATRSTFGS